MFVSEESGTGFVWMGWHLNASQMTEMHIKGPTPRPSNTK